MMALIRHADSDNCTPRSSKLPPSPLHTLNDLLTDGFGRQILATPQSNKIYLKYILVREIDSLIIV